jgi:pilus assembly protein CpaC
MKSLTFLLAAAALLLAGCSRDQGHADAAIPPTLASAPAPEPAAAPPQGTVATPAPAKTAEPDPEPTPQEIAAFNARVPK